MSKPALTKMRDALANGEFPQFDIKWSETCFYGLSRVLGCYSQFRYDMSEDMTIHLTIPKDYWDESYSRERCILALDRLIDF